MEFEHSVDLRVDGIPNEETYKDEQYVPRIAEQVQKLVNTKKCLKNTHLVTTFRVKRPRRNFMKQEIANCIKFRKELTKYSYNDVNHMWKLDSKYVIAEEN